MVKKNIVRLILSSDDLELRIIENIFPDQEQPQVKIIDGFSEDADNDYPSTLKDISIIMEAMVGHGITWQLAYELSQRLRTCNNPYEISETLSDIFYEYFNMSEEEAWQKFESYPRLYAPST